MPLAMPALPCVSTPPHTCVQGVHLSACVCVGGASLVSLCGYGKVSSQWWWCRHDHAQCSHVQGVCVCVSLGGEGRV